MVVHVRGVVDKVGCSPLYQWGHGIALSFENVQIKKYFPELVSAAGRRTKVPML